MHGTNAHYTTLHKLLQDFELKQKKQMNSLSKKCAALELTLSSIDQMISLDSNRADGKSLLHSINKLLSDNKMQKLQIKQLVFMQEELEKKVRRLQEEKEALGQEMQLKEQECYDLTENLDRMAEQNLKLAKQIDRRNEQVEKLASINKQLQKAQKPDHQLLKNKQYEALEQQLRQIESTMSQEL